MVKRRLLFATGEGIGNVLQTIPTIRTLVEVLGYSVDMWHAFGSFPLKVNVIPYVDNLFSGNSILNIPLNRYCGVVSTFWTKNHMPLLTKRGAPLLNNIKSLSMDRSEVDTYMDIARDLGVKEEDILWDGSCNYTELPINGADVVLHDGYNPHGSANWKIKSYPYYKELAKLFIDKGLRVASVGSDKEYIEGTDSFTGLPLLSTFGFIKKSKLFIGNDSGLYHAANALGVKNVVIFTATSINKNYDSRFHKYSTIVRNNLSCSPCQATRKWNNGCTDWKCRDIDPKIIADIC